MVDSKTLAQAVLKLASKPNAEKNIEKFIAYLAESNLQGLLPQVVAHIERITLRSAQSNTLHISSKFKLSDVDVKNIQTLAGAESAIVEEHVDESVIGGFSATYAGFIYDGSLENQITQFKNMLTK